MDGSMYSQIFDWVADALSIASQLCHADGVESVVVDGIAVAAWKAMSIGPSSKC